MLKKTIAVIQTRFKKTLILVAGVIVFLFIMNFRDCRVRPESTATSSIAITEVDYRPPLIRLPFTKSKQPVKNAELPIPADLVDKTLEFTIAPSPSRTDFVLVIGRDGKVYGTLPDNVDVKIVNWKKRFVRFTLRPAYSMVYSDGFYHCISLDLIAINRFSIGVDLGTNVDFNKYLAGISARIRMADIDTFFKKDIGFLALAGWDGFSGRLYFGLSLQW